MKEYKNSKGEVVLNTNFAKGYALAQRNDKFVAIDLIGEEFEFDRFENAARFIHSANKWDDSRILIYNEIKVLEE